jgi:hypothetical protein
MLDGQHLEQLSGLRYEKPQRLLASGLQLPNLKLQLPGLASQLPLQYLKLRIQHHVHQCGLGF